MKNDKEHSTESKHNNEAAIRAPIDANKNKVAKAQKPKDAKSKEAAAIRSPVDA